MIPVRRHFTDCAQDKGLLDLRRIQKLVDIGNEFLEEGDRIAAWKIHDLIGHINSEIYWRLESFTRQLDDVFPTQEQS